MADAASHQRAIRRTRVAAGFRRFSAIPRRRRRSSTVGRDNPRLGQEPSCEARAGDVLLIAVGPGRGFVLDAEALGWAGETGLAAIATDGVPALRRPPTTSPRCAVGRCRAWCDDSRGDDVWDGLLSIAPRNVLGRTSPTPSFGADIRATNH